ncbi:hypothetical protein MAPG_11278 [Magnaporthiopsis poae ATCC 64411]|uniref:Uncharacterized protein n=1 Tax=Magnaporthiopsis poae (strain ATCC 64411 / 73-15) TaxID=644358 RepID=A0A0C4EEU7_MAGP6|nr:hypothetical protein MAPG_11278 [Magnaporthiopsis poae ATCC 64411]
MASPSRPWNKKLSQAPTRTLGPSPSNTSRVDRNRPEQDSHTGKDSHPSAPKTGQRLSSESAFPKAAGRPFDARLWVASASTNSRLPWSPFDGTKKLDTQK